MRASVVVVAMLICASCAPRGRGAHDATGAVELTAEACVLIARMCGREDIAAACMGVDASAHAIRRTLAQQSCEGAPAP